MAYDVAVINNMALCVSGHAARDQLASGRLGGKSLCAWKDTTYELWF